MERRPVLTSEDVAHVVKSCYGLDVTKQTTLNSYDDVNIHVNVDNKSENSYISSVSGDGYVLKILNSADSKKTDFIEAMHGAIDCVAGSGIRTPQPVLSTEGRMYTLHSFQTADGSDEFLVRLFHYLPGELLKDKPYTKRLCFQVGQLAGHVNNALKNFSHPSLSGHTRHWNLREVKNLTSLVDCITDPGDRKLICDVTEEFMTNVLASSDKLQRGVIHGDLNEGNILVQLNPNAPENDKYDVHGVLDFGDLVNEYHVYDVAIAIAYVMLESKHGLDPLEAGGHVLAGYLAEVTLPKEDCQVVKECIAARLAQSLTYGAYSHKLDPGNTYCLHTSKVGWSLLKRLSSISKNELYRHWCDILEGYKLKTNVKNCYK